MREGVGLTSLPEFSIWLWDMVTLPEFSISLWDIVMVGKQGVNVFILYEAGGWKDQGKIWFCLLEMGRAFIQNI